MFIYILILYLNLSLGKPLASQIKAGCTSTAEKRLTKLKLTKMSYCLLVYEYVSFSKSQIMSPYPSKMEPSVSNFPYVG